MDRHAWLAAQSWLQEELEENLPSTASPSQQPQRRTTAFVGAASLHVSLQEQYGLPLQFAGACAPDAVHLSFTTAASSAASGGKQQQQLDPMQLRCAVERAIGGLRLILVLDGRHYALRLDQAKCLVLPAPLATLLPPSTEPAAPGAALLAPAPPSPLPYLTLVFPHSCLNLFPLGYKGVAAGCMDPRHNAAEVARLAALLLEHRCQEAASAQLAQLEPASGAAVDWPARYAEFAWAVQQAVDAALRLGAASATDIDTAACRQLALAAGAAAAAAGAAGTQLAVLLHAAEAAQVRLDAALQAQWGGAAQGGSQQPESVASAFAALSAARQQAAACAALAG